MIIKFEYYWKCIRIYEKAHLISDFRKKYLLSWGSNPRNETKPEEIYDNERVCDRKIVLSFLLGFSNGYFFLNPYLGEGTFVFIFCEVNLNVGKFGSLPGDSYGS